MFHASWTIQARIQAILYKAMKHETLKFGERILLSTEFQLTRCGHRFNVRREILAKAQVHYMH